MRLALIQNHCSPDRDENLGRALSSMEQAKESGADMVVFPELAIDRFFPQHEEWNAHEIAEPIPGPTTRAIGAKAKSNACFNEKTYYNAGDTGARVYDTAVGRIGVAICYDRHYPEYMRALGVHGAQLVAIPQAGAVDEWPEGVFEAEVQAAAFQNGYFAALCNRVGKEERLTFGGESFVVDPSGRVVTRGVELDDDLVIADIDLTECDSSQARTLFWRDRRPDLYGDWLT